MLRLRRDIRSSFATVAIFSNSSRLNRVASITFSLPSVTGASRFFFSDAGTVCYCSSDRRIEHLGESFARDLWREDNVPTTDVSSGTALIATSDASLKAEIHESAMGDSKRGYLICWNQK